MKFQRLGKRFILSYTIKYICRFLFCFSFVKFSSFEELASLKRLLCCAIIFKLADGQNYCSFKNCAYLKISPCKYGQGIIFYLNLIKLSLWPSFNLSNRLFASSSVSKSPTNTRYQVPFSGNSLEEIAG
jgi:hypothetical protein